MNIDLFDAAYILAGLTAVLLSASGPAFTALQCWIGLLLVVIGRRWKRRGVAAAPIWAFASTLGLIVDALRSIGLGVALVRYYGLRRGLTWPGVQLQPLFGPNQAAHLIVVVPGTWHKPQSIEFGMLRELIVAIGSTSPLTQVVLARWPSWNKQSARWRAADELAKCIKGHVGDDAITVSFVGHSHGGTVAAATALQLGSISIGTVVTLGSPLVAESSVRLKRGTGSTSGWPFVTLVFATCSLIAFGLTITIYGPFPALAHTAQVVLFEAIWGALVIIMIIGYFYLLSRASKHFHAPLEYVQGSRVTAIYATEDILMKGLLASELLRRSSDAAMRRLERVMRRRYEPKSFRRMHWQSPLQLCLCLLSPVLMMYVLPEYGTEIFKYIVILVGTITISAIVTHVFPNPYIEWVVSLTLLMFSGVIRGAFGLARLALCGVQVASLPYRTFAFSGIGLQGEKVRLIRTGYSSLSAHSEMLRHPAVIKVVTKALLATPQR